jgi:hypothetical protein
MSQKTKQELLDSAFQMVRIGNAAKNTLRGSKFAQLLVRGTSAKPSSEDYANYLNIGAITTFAASQDSILEATKDDGSRPLRELLDYAFEVKDKQMRDKLAPIDVAMLELFAVASGLWRNVVTIDDMPNERKSIALWEIVYAVHEISTGNFGVLQEVRPLIEVIDEKVPQLDLTPYLELVDDAWEFADRYSLQELAKAVKAETGIEMNLVMALDNE